MSWGTGKRSFSPVRQAYPLTPSKSEPKATWSSCQFHHMVNMVGYRLHIGIECRVLFNKLLNDRLGVGVRIMAPSFPAVYSIPRAVRVAFAHRSIQKVCAEVDLDNAAVLAQALDHVVVHIALKPGVNCRQEECEAITGARGNFHNLPEGTVRCGKHPP